MSVFFSPPQTRRALSSPMLPRQSIAVEVVSTFASCEPAAIEGKHGRPDTLFPGVYEVSVISTHNVCLTCPTNTRARSLLHFNCSVPRICHCAWGAEFNFMRTCSTNYSLVIATLLVFHAERLKRRDTLYLSQRTTRRKEII